MEVVVVRACKPVNGGSAVMVGSANLRGGRPVCFGSGEVGLSGRLMVGAWVAVRWRGCLR